MVAPGAASDQAATRLNQLPGSPQDPRALPDESTARHQIKNRDTDGALVINPTGIDTLLVASGGGRILSTTLPTLVTTLERSERRPFRTVDVIPSAWAP